MTFLGAPFLFVPAAQRDAAAAIGEAVAGPDALTVLVGAAGAGKTTVLDRVAAELAGRPVRVVRVSGAVPGGLGLAGLVEQVGRQAGPHATPDEQRERAFEVLTELDDGAERIALLVDDAHGLQPEALRYVQLACRSSPMLRAVLASLPGESTIGGERIARRVELSALSDDEALAFARHLLRAGGVPARGALPPAALNALVRRGEGNPGRISSLLRADAAPGNAPERPDAEQSAPAPGGVPRRAPLESIPPAPSLAAPPPAEPVRRPILRAMPSQSWGRTERTRPPVRRGRALRWALAGVGIGTSLAAAMLWVLAGMVPKAAPAGAPDPAAAASPSPPPGPNRAARPAAGVPSDVRAPDLRAND